MMMINQVLLSGRLADDVEVKSVSNDNLVANFTVVTNEKLDSGKEITQYTRCVAWNYLAEFCRDLKRGQMVTVVGRIHTRKWEEKYFTEVNVSVVTAGEKSMASKEAPAPGPPGMKKPSGNGGSFPFDDKHSGITWDLPDADGYSYSSAESGGEHAACWNDPKDPTRGGTLYKLNGDDWVESRKIPEDANIPF